ncbi:hypothetical protein K2173_002121 [Erythroxylum novogranatense]|uniref:Transcription initiation factor TFIID subunit 8 n=1 Tax=Erythroxylum novogranatense TaxID=1862640 RepID=A0AAV8SPK8_9ROSI|nr:hypothetical protein K2173_002121 [Erythroxylum novogranatense]
MRNGGARNTSGRPKADEFGRAVARVAVAQICLGLGFQGFKESAVDSLTEITIRYLRDLGRSARFYSNLSGRTQCHVFDIVRCLEDLSISGGFADTSSSGNCLVSFGTVRRIIEFVDSSEEIPFAQPVPSFPVSRDARLIPSFVKMGEATPGKHIPPWLPALPDPHTYLHTPMWNERVSDPRAEKIEQARQRRKAERALLGLQQRLLANGSIEASTSADRNGEDKELGVAETNTSVSVPSKSEEMDVSAVVVPDKLKDHVSVMDAFAPAIEALKESRLGDDGDSERRMLPGKRPTVNFRLKARKKMLGESLDLRLSKKGEGRMRRWLGRDEERDDRKRRAEYILKQSMENPQELTLL